MVRQAQRPPESEPDFNSALGRLGKEIFLAGLRLVVDENGDVLSDFRIEAEVDEGGIAFGFPRPA